MVMVLQIVATSGSNGVQLMIRQRMTELSAGSSQGIIEAIIGIVHLICSEHCLQTPFIEAGIVSYEGNGGYLVSHIIKFLVREVHIGYAFLQLLPHFGEYWRIVRIAFRNAMNSLTPVIIVVWFRLNQTIERVHYLSVTHHDHSYGADT